MMLSSGVALLTFITIFVGYDFISFRAGILAEADTLADNISLQSNAAVMFDDTHAADEILQTLNNGSRTINACIYSENGKLLASYQNKAYKRILDRAIRRRGNSGDRIQPFAALNGPGFRLQSCSTRMLCSHSGPYATLL